MQCLSVFPVLLCVFVGVIYLVFNGTKSALLASIIIMSSSHNIFTFLCCCSVDRFILTVAIWRYDCKFNLNTLVKKLYVVGTCKP